MSRENYISVVVPVFNVENYLEECIESLVNQDIENYEIILINDGSTDNSGNIAENYASQHSNVRVIHQVNKGLSAARNRGIQESLGKYICFVDSDDFIRPNCLKNLMNIISKNKLDLLMFDAHSFLDTGNFKISKEEIMDYSRAKTYGIYSTGQELFFDLKSNQEYYPSACLYIFKKEIIEKYGIQFVEGITHEDELFTVQLMLACKKSAHINEPIYQRRYRPGSIMTSQKLSKEFLGRTVVFQKFDKIYNDGKFNSNKIRYAFKENMRATYMTLLKLIHNLPSSEKNKLKDEINQINSIAKNHRYFNWKGRLAARNYTVFKQLSRIYNTLKSRS